MDDAAATRTSRTSSSPATRRGTGHGPALIEAVYARADALGADRVYWHTQEYNGAARSLYDQVAHRTSFVVYERLGVRAP